MSQKRGHNSTPPEHSGKRNRVSDPKQDLLNEYFPTVLTRVIWDYLSAHPLRLGGTKSKGLDEYYSVCCVGDEVWVLQEFIRNPRVWKIPLSSSETTMATVERPELPLHSYRATSDGKQIRMRQHFELSGLKCIAPILLRSNGIHIEDRSFRCACTSDGRFLVAYSNQRVSPFGTENQLGNLIVFDRSTGKSKILRQDFFVEGIVFSQVAIDWCSWNKKYSVVGLDRNDSCFHLLVQDLETAWKENWQTIPIYGTPWPSVEKTNQTIALSLNERCLILVDGSTSHVWMYWF